MYTDAQKQGAPVKRDVDVTYGEETIAFYQGRRRYAGGEIVRKPFCRIRPRMFMTCVSGRMGVSIEDVASWIMAPRTRVGER